MLPGIAALSSACTSSHQLPPPIDNRARNVVETARYEVRHRGEVVGSVVQLQMEDPSGPLQFWRVENKNGAWLGHASALGRFSRRLPFRDDEQDIGIWPMAQGVAQLLEVDGEVALREVPVAVPASVTRKP